MKYLKAVGLVLIAALVVSCAAKLPQKDIDAAEAALSDAQTAQAEVYAPTEYQAAMDAKSALDTELETQAAKQSGKSYKQVTELAKALVTAANSAKSAAETNLATVKDEVATLLADTETVLKAVAAESASATANKAKAVKAKIDVKAVAAQVEAAAQTMADAQSANDSGDYMAAKDQLSTLKDELVQLQTTLEAAGYTAE